MKVTKPATKSVKPTKVSVAKKSSAQILKEAEVILIKKYKHIVPGTLRSEPKVGRRSVEAKLSCGHVERVFTSDLFQVKRCKDCRLSSNTKRLAELKAKKQIVPVKAPAVKVTSIPKSTQIPKKAKVTVIPASKVPSTTEQWD